MISRVLLFILITVAVPASLAAQSGSTCLLPAASHQWMQRALNGWAVIKSDLLKMGPSPLPWMIFFDSHCAWHVSPDLEMLPAGKPVPQTLQYERATIPIAAVEHGGELLLPDGRRIPVGPTVFTAPRPGLSRSYFIVALPDIWRPLWKPTDPKLEEFFLGVSAHELTHTVQINTILERVKDLKKRGGEIPKDLNDDIVENTFKDDAEYRPLFERERDLFFDAALQEDDARSRVLAREALRLVDERHRRFFTGSRAVFRSLDGMFLNMEGVASWVQFEMARRDPANFSAEDSIVKTKGRSTNWSQGEGLALMLLVDRFVPDWRRRMFPPELASPITLLHEALELPTSGRVRSASD